MAKGEDAVRRRRKNKINRRASDDSASVSARVASIIATKRRRKSGRRRICEGMCFSLPTPEDPFNDRYDKRKTVAVDGAPHSKPRQIRRRSPKSRVSAGKAKPFFVDDGENTTGGFGSYSISKFLVLCLKIIQDARAEAGLFDACADASLLASTWGLQLWRRLSNSNAKVVEAGGACATSEQVAWLASTASDLFANREKQGLNVATPFLLYLVPSQQKALQVRSVCKPLKALGVHTVSLHPGASLDHQLCCLKSCEPEFLISTPERVLELVSLKAIDISGVSLLVLDGLKHFEALGVSGKVEAIKGKITKGAQVVIFTGGSGGDVNTCAVEKR